MVRANVVVGSSVCVHWLAINGMWRCSGFWMAVASGTRINKQLARDTIYRVHDIYFGKTSQKHLHCKTHMNVVLFQSKKCTVNRDTVKM